VNLAGPLSSRLLCVSHTYTFMMTKDNYWTCGDIILYRGIWYGEVLWAIPVIVVKDNSDLIIVYWEAGTPVKRPERRMSPLELLEGPKPILVDR
jgi:hypothetical protein